MTNRPVFDPAAHQFGVTLDRLKSMDQVVDALHSFAVTPITRVVFDPGVKAKDYRSALEQIRGVSFVLGELMDSFDFKNISTADYLKRVKEYVATLGDVVDIWEFGNEVNGEWLGPADEVMAKITEAFQYLHGQGCKTALTLYYNAPCIDKAEHEMFRWLETLPLGVKMGVDYALISYYEQDCNNVRPDWPVVFQRLGVVFPTAKLGFGEVGTVKASLKESYLRTYYTLKINHPRYIGGGYWWYFFKDMVPKSRPLWTTLNNVMKGK